MIDLGNLLAARKSGENAGRKVGSGQSDGRREAGQLSAEMHHGCMWTASMLDRGHAFLGCRLATQSRTSCVAWSAVGSQSDGRARTAGAVDRVAYASHAPQADQQVVGRPGA